MPTSLPTLPPLAPPSQVDVDCIRLAQSGDARAFSRLVGLWLPPVYAFLFRMTGDAQQAEDLSQETFIKAYRNLSRFDTRRSFKPWLFRIAVNTARSAFRAKRPAGIPLEEAFIDADPAGPDEMQALEARFNSQIALEAVMKLDIRYRQALWLRYQEELSYEEVADAMQTPLNTVRTWIRRGLQTLRRELTGALDS
ncbi:MAG: sigma-70 family RNA polymerase sigma factor [Vampirovibrionales bacterium]|nr:sigma-70 family RNA polymerase sigma factor [Vampirovibrionales bacterium]